jgi:localization factor PodJL
MGRAYPSSPAHDHGQDAGEWQTLRGELVALLDQVESQVARSRQEDPGYHSIADRMRYLRDQVADAEPDTRHREALRSVKRAVDRFSDRDDGYASRESSPPNPRDMLQSAIQQIRARHMGMPVPRTSRPSDQPRFDELAQAVSGISGRLERLESELRHSARSQTGNVKEIAEQVAQLSHVVELLAGAVGETGQVKRLEAQIAGLAKLVSQGPQADLTALTQRLDQLGGTIDRLVERHDGAAVVQRLDDVTATMGRLADLQVQFANRVDTSAKASDRIHDGVITIEAGIKDGMQAIEKGVRNIYDRIDALERGTALPQADVDRLAEEMARFTEAMNNPVQPQGMIELIDRLDRRIAAIESTDGDVTGLKADVGALRNIVVEALEPRFAALEMQLEALSERVGDRPAGDMTVGQLEAQVRQLVARMDQTGEQLSGLAKLYSQPSSSSEPDYDALAEIVAARTSEAVAQHQTPPIAAGFDSAGIDEIERRVSRLFDAAQKDRPSEDLAAIETSIGEVNQRLARLEKMVAENACEPEHIVTMPAAPVDAVLSPFIPAPRVVAEHEASVLDPIAPLLAEAAQTAMQEARGVELATMRAEAMDVQQSRSDAMPSNPAAEAPLTDRPFGDPSPIEAALEAKNGPRKRHPGLSYEPLPGQGLDLPPEEAARVVHTSTARPHFDPEKVERPPRPISTFETPEHDGFAELRPAPPEAPQEPAPEDTPSTNTFIAAARRAAQRQHGNKPVPVTSSLIARALANFQPGARPQEAKSKPEKPERESRKDKTAQPVATDAAAPASRIAAPVPPPPVRPTGPQAPEPIALDQEAPGSALGRKESFLARHRRPILLAASVVAIVFLTLNLINQRMAGGERQPAVRADVSEAEPVPAPLAGESVATMPAAVTSPRIVPIVDSLATASIDPAAAQGFAPMGEAPQMPATFQAIATAERSSASGSAGEKTIETATLHPQATIDQLPPEIDSPVEVEMPPDALGPEPLRRAAARGDARAQFEIAAIYTEGRAVPEDLAAAAIWYERAAAQGFAPAQYRLGNLYENGRGVAKDLQQARLWYQRAAEAGNRMAMHNLAALYAGGELGKQEFEAAAEWFEQAALRGMRDSQFNLGMLHARGLGVPQSLEESYRWFALAAARGDADAGNARDDVARSLDAEAVSRLNDEIAAFKAAPVDLVANFAPIGTWAEKFDPGQTITKPEIVKSVQAALDALGFDVGTPDGIAGPKTAEAIRAFERTTGMSESGAINPRLLAVLGSQPV